MDAYSVAAQLLGDMKLSSGQLGQIRALDYRLQLELHRLSKQSPPSTQPAGAASPLTGAQTSPTPQQLAALRAMLISDLRDMLTPEQRAQLDKR